jgi:hypothetical protein
MAWLRCAIANARGRVRTSRDFHPEEDVPGCSPDLQGFVSNTASVQLLNDTTIAASPMRDAIRVARSIAASEVGAG